MVICVTRGSLCLPRWPWAGPCGGPAGPNGSAPKTRNVFWGRSSPEALLSVPAGLQPGRRVCAEEAKKDQSEHFRFPMRSDPGKLAPGEMLVVHV